MPIENHTPANPMELFVAADGEQLPLPLVGMPVHIHRRADMAIVGHGSITLAHPDGTANVRVSWDGDPRGNPSHLAGVAHPKQPVQQHEWFCWTLRPAPDPIV